MKKNVIAKIEIYFILFMFFTSCQYGFQEAFGRPDEANQRSAFVTKLNGTDFDPKITEKKFSVLLVTDVHFGRGERKEELFFKKLSEITAEEKEFPMKFAICVGDSVETGVERYYDQYVNFCDQLKKNFSIQMYSVPGNHDLYNSGFSIWKRKVYPYVASYTFSTDNGAQPISWYFLDSGNGTLGKKQLESFMEIALDDPNPKIVITHYPIYAGGGLYFTMQNRNERDTLLSTFAKTKTLMVLEGHAHKNKDYSYPGYFVEHMTASYLDGRAFAILYVDIDEGNCRYERYGY